MKGIIEMHNSHVFHAFSNINWGFKYIYFYGKISPTVSLGTFSGVLPASVMTLSTYQGAIYEGLRVSKGTIIDEYLPPTLTFTPT